MKEGEQSKQIQCAMYKVLESKTKAEQELAVENLEGVFPPELWEGYQKDLETVGLNAEDRFRILNKLLVPWLQSKELLA